MSKLQLCNSYNMVMFASLLAFAPGAAAQTTERVSVTSAGQQVWAQSEEPEITAAGNLVAFGSYAHALVRDDTNGFRDIFVRNRSLNATRRVSVNSEEMQANWGTGLFATTSLSGDGRFVAFISFSSNLVAGDTNGDYDVFVRDRLTQTTERVNVSSTGGQANNFSGNVPSLNGNGRYVAFVSLASNLVSDDTNLTYDVFVRDRVTGVTKRVSVDSSGIEGNGESFFPALSGDGRYVVFQSDANNLVAGDTNGATDVFIHDLDSHLTKRVSVNSSGQQANNASQVPVISEHGRFIAFDSYASNLVAGDTNNMNDIFVRDRMTGTTQRISISSEGGQANNVGLSSNSRGFDMSIDGRFIAFGSVSTNLVSGDTNGVEDIFVRDRVTGTTERVNVSTSGAQGNKASLNPAISNDGRFIAFDSDASNLVLGDTNNIRDVFLRDRGP